MYVYLKYSEITKFVIYKHIITPVFLFIAIVTTSPAAQEKYFEKSCFTKPGNNFFHLEHFCIMNIPFFHFCPLCIIAPFASLPCHSIRSCKLDTEMRRDVAMHAFF